MKNKKIIAIIIVVCAIVVALLLFLIGQNVDENVSDEPSKQQEQTVENDSLSDTDDDLDIVEKKDESSNEGIVEQVDGTFEEWLAAGTVIAITLQYPEYEFTNIYLASETELSNHEDSKGVYVFFNTAQDRKIICAKPLTEERTEVGTVDLYTKNIGFATFDEVNIDQESITNMKEITMDQLNGYISQSVLVTLYEH